VARWFDPSLGRFLSPDTIVPTSTQGTQAWDRYAFVNNNPVRYTDPTGHVAEDDCDPASEQCDYQLHTETTSTDMKNIEGQDVGCVQYGMDGQDCTQIDYFALSNTNTQYGFYQTVFDNYYKPNILQSLGMAGLETAVGLLPDKGATGLAMSGAEYASDNSKYQIVSRTGNVIYNQNEKNIGSPLFITTITKAWTKGFASPSDSSILMFNKGGQSDTILLDNSTMQTIFSWLTQNTTSIIP